MVADCDCDTDADAGRESDGTAPPPPLSPPSLPSATPCVGRAVYARTVGEPIAGGEKSSSIGVGACLASLLLLHILALKRLLG